MEWPLFCLVINRAKRLQDMMERLDVDAMKLVRLRQGEAYEAARTTCLHCNQATRCVDWVELNRDPMARPEFCPNLPLLERVRRP